MVFILQAFVIDLGLIMRMVCKYKTLHKWPFFVVFRKVRLVDDFQLRRFRHKAIIVGSKMKSYSTSKIETVTFSFNCLS